MKKIILLFVLFFIALQTGFGQSNLGIKAGIGLSRMSWDADYAGSSNIPPDAYCKCIAPSGQLGISFHSYPLEKALVGADLVFNQWKGIDKYKFQPTDNYGTPIGSGKLYNKKNITALSLPVYFGYDVAQKLNLNLGFQISYLLKSRWRSEASLPKPLSDMDTTFDWAVNRLDYGPRVGVLLSLSEKISLEGVYYHGLSNILENPFNNAETKIQQLIVGIRYKID